jgi:hypothetical protein
MMDLTEGFDSAVAAWVGGRDLRPSTRRAYLLELGRLEEWGAARSSMSATTDLQSFDMQAFLRWVSDAHATRHDGALPSRGSIEQTKRIVSAFLRYWATQAEVPARDAWTVDAASLRDIAGAADVEALESVCINKAKSHCNILLGQDFSESRAGGLMANLAFWCCATSGEIAAMRQGDMSPDSSEIRVGRGRQWRTVRIPRHLGDQLLDHLKMLPARRESLPLFMSARHKALRASAVRAAVRKALGSDATAAPPQELRRAFLALARPQPVPTSDVAYRAGNTGMRARASRRDVAGVALQGIARQLRS